jgi:hypothetical protein
MPNYAVTKYSTGTMNSVDLAAAALETYIETVDDAKTIYTMGIMPTGRDKEQCVGWVIHKT